MLIFVLLIVILFEATTLATLSIGKAALSKNIQESYLRSANELADKVGSAAGRPSPDTLQNLVAGNGRAGAIAFLVDNSGALIAHPDKKRALQHELMTRNGAVARLLAGQAGAGEFQDELGSAMVGAYVPIGKFGWAVVVEEPIASAYFEMRRLETNSLLFVIAGIILTALTGIFFARSIEKPIKSLHAGDRGGLARRARLSYFDRLGGRDGQAGPPPSNQMTPRPARQPGAPDPL